MVIRIKKRDLDSIFYHAEKSYPLEACGILVGMLDGKTKNVEEIHHTGNVLNSSSEYQIDPSEQLKVFEEMDIKGLRIFGFYHSHTFWDSFWSKTDDERSEGWI